MTFLDRGLVEARAARTTTTTPTVTAPTAREAYEARTGDRGNVVSPAAPAPSPVVTAPPPATTYTPPVNTGTGPSPEVVTPATPVISEPADEVVAESADAGFNDTLARFTEEDIAAALAAIEAEFGLTKEELLRDQTMIGAQYRLLTAQMARQKEKALGQAESGALQRGLFRSGIYAAEVGEVAGAFDEQQAALETDTNAQQLGISQKLATIEADKARAKAEEEAAIRRGEYTTRLQAAGL